MNCAPLSQETFASRDTLVNCVLWPQEAFADTSLFGSRGQTSISQFKLCQHFSSDTMPYLCFDTQLSYFIHRCIIVRERLFILMLKGQRSFRTELCHTSISTR